MALSEVLMLAASFLLFTDGWQGAAASGRRLFKSAAGKPPLLGAWRVALDCRLSRDLGAITRSDF